MAKRIFISYNFNDREIVNTVKSMMQNNYGKIQGKAVFVEGDLSQYGHSDIDNEIKKVMRNCDVALFVIGDSNHNSPWINREAELAISLGLSIVITRLPETTGGVPWVLSNFNQKITKWSSIDLSYCLNSLPKEKVY